MNTIKTTPTAAIPTTTPVEPSPSVRASRVGELLGTTRSTSYVYMRMPGFPKPRKISPRCVLFDRNELLAWRDTHTAGDA